VQQPRQLETLDDLLAQAAQRWTDPDKFVKLVIDQTLARMKRGSAFLPPKTGLAN
jgi:hypothetical protein